MSIKIINNFPTQTNTNMLHEYMKIAKIKDRLAHMTCIYINKAKINNTSVKDIIDNHVIVPSYKKRKSKVSILDKINLTTLTPIPSTLCPH